MKIIIGLGNPGVKYAKNRHNVGFLFIDYLRQEFNAPDLKEKSKFKALVSEFESGEEKFLLVKPLTFMNESGQTIVALENFYKVGYENFLICYDDIDLVFPDLRYRDSGSAGTHNGMRSIISLTGTEDIPRLRFGIDVQDRRAELRSFVLSDFSEDEQSNLTKFMQAGFDLLNDKFI